MKILKFKMLCLSIINYVAVFVRIKKKENEVLDDKDSYLYVETVINDNCYGLIFNHTFSGSWHLAVNQKNWAKKNNTSNKRA